MKTWKKFLFLILFVFVISARDVYAAKERTVTVEDKLYYYTSLDSKYGSYYGTSSGSNATKYTRYKHINNNPAYCVQSEDLSPANGATYVEVGVDESIEDGTWETEDIWITGFIIQLIDDDFSGNEAYVMTYAALNSYLTGTLGGKNFAAYNTKVANYISEAKKQYQTYFTKSLPDFTAKAVSKVLEKNSSGSTVYYKGSLKLSGLYSDFGGTHIYGDETDDVTYTLSSDSFSFCSDSSCKSTTSTLSYTGVSGDKTVYVKATNVNPGDSLSVKITASNESYYNMGRLWKPKTGNSQILLGKGYESGGHLTRSRVKTVNFTVPEPDKKTVTLMKVDASTGDTLSGASLSLQLSGGSTKSCSISGGSKSCKIEITDEITSDIYYSVTEASAPSGYVIGSSIKDAKLNFDASTNTCYIVTEEGTTETDFSDCSRVYDIADFCETTDNGLVKGRCEEAEDYTGLIQKEDGLWYDEVTDALVETIPTTTVGTNHLDVCYYEANGSYNEVDKSKCTNQYMQVTNSGSNVIVEYYNNKNRVEISKYAINGQEELRGAELKICTTEPDANGNCTIARNTLSGQCITSSTTEDGYLNISSDVNCTSNGDGTKTVDMQWTSGVASKVWYGVPAGTYYLVETVSPNGYLPLITAVKFSIDENGIITSDSYDQDNDKIIVKNSPTKISVSKIASDTGKALEGASLSICSSYKDENGNYQMRVGESGFCIPAVLAGNVSATLTTTDKATTIEGLSVGTYFLAELEAPEGYTVADPIMFTLNSDGTITDKDGKLIDNNELIMVDDPIQNQKTGELPVLTIVLIGLGAIAVCGVSYYYLVKKNGIEILKNKFKKNK